MTLSRFLRASLLAALPLATLAIAPAPAGAAEPFDNDELVAGVEFIGLPDKDTHSGVFLDLIAVGSSSITGPNVFGIRTDPGQTTLRVAIFDGNAGGLWDQNRLENDANGNPIPDGSVVEYDLLTASPSFPETVVALADSENATPRPGASIFPYAVDGRWQFLYDGPQHPNALIAPNQYAYRLVVRYRLPTPSGPGLAPINGYKVAVNAPFGLIPFSVGEALVGGFIGGVVDSRNLLFTPPGGVGPADEYSVSRDHYPEGLEPDASLNTRLTNGPVYLPAVRYPAPDAAFVNNYNGTFDIRVSLVPAPGQTWPQFIEDLILEEGDADDFDDASGISPEGLPSPSNRGIPPDDGRPYVDNNGISHDNSGYRLPIAAQPSDAGSPYLEVYDPNGILRLVLTDLSGNVSQEDATGANFEKIPLPLDGIPGIWTLRVHNLDARNSWFLRTNAAFVPESARLSGRVYCDLDCDDSDEEDTEPGLGGIRVIVQRTDVVGEPPIEVVTAADGSWVVENIRPGVYDCSVAPGQAEGLMNKTPSAVQPKSANVPNGGDIRNVDFGYCEKHCECGPDGRVHQVCLEASIWTPDPATTHFDVYVRADQGCECGPMIDLSCFEFDGAFPGTQKGRNGLIQVNDVKVVDGYVKVNFCLDATAPWFPMGYFTGSVRFEVVVNCVGEAVCAPVDCRCMTVGGVFPKSWKPLWCDDVPDFFVKSYLAWDCWEDKPCTDGCTRTKGYWKTHNKYAKTSGLKVAWPAPADEDTSKLCGRTWLCVLSTSPRGEAWYILGSQWVAAQLNEYAGACVPPAVRDAMVEGKALLEGSCEGLCGLAADRAIQLAAILDAYNNGKMGPVHCADETCEPPTTCDPKPKCNPKPKCDPKGDKDCTPKGNDCDKPKDKDCTPKGNDCDKPKDKDCAPKGNDCDKPKDKDCAPKGNNGVGNGLDPQPPGNPPVNDGPGTSPGKPGNRKK